VPSVSLRIPMQDLLINQLGFSIGVQGVLGSIFINRTVARSAIDRSRRREYEFVYAAGPQSLKHADAGSDIALEEDSRINDGFGYECFGGEMKNCVERIAGCQLPNLGGVSDIQFHERRTGWDSITESGGEVINNRYSVSPAEQLGA